MKRLNRFVLLALVYPFAVAKVLGRRGIQGQKKSRKRTVGFVASVAWVGMVLALVLNIGVTDVPANANNCQVGSSSTCPATSPQEIYNLYGTTTNGVYWLRVNGVARETFVAMDRSASWGSGSWVLLMKGARGSSNFGYSSTNFTSNSSVVNEASPTNNFTADAKYHAYNSLPLSQAMAVISSPQNGSISNQGDIANNSFSGHTWVETAGGVTAQNRLTNYSSRDGSGDAFTRVPYSKYRQTSSASSNQVFSYQTGTGLYGYDVSCGTGYKARWGILWNNETNNTTSCDAYVGIGGSTGTVDQSPGDRVTYNDALTFAMPTDADSGLGEFAFQIWGKMAEPSQTAPAAPAVANAALGSVTVSWVAPAGSPTDYVVQYKLTSTASWGTNPSQSVVVTGTNATITGLSNSTSYDFRVMARTSGNSSAPSSATSFSITPRTISFNANGGTNSMADVVVADSVATTLPSNSFVRDRHTFRGWNSAANGTGTVYTDAQQFTAQANVTLYAQWTSLDDKAWNKGNLDGEYAFLNNTSDPVIPTASTAAWTVEAWVRPDSFSTTWTNLFGQQVNADPYSGRNSIWLSNGQIVLAGPAGIDSNTGYFLPLNRWTHVAWVMTTTASSQLYVDGKLVWDGSVTRGTGGTHFAIGGSRQTGYVSFDGNIDQFKVWGVTLTATQVANSMHTYGSTFTGPPAAGCATGLRAHYDFNEFNAGVVLDRSGCGRHLAFNTGVAGSYAESNFTSSAIVQTGTAFTSQNWVKFNRSYLTAAGGWTRPAAASLVKSLVVAGGGGGGAWVGAGGGAGGATTTASTLLSSSVVTVTVGQGGRGARFDGTSFVDVGSSGQNSSFGLLSATGGGLGGSWLNAPIAGGSGGGGAGGTSGASRLGAAPISGQGFKGGDGNSTTYYPSGGGGGAGGAGQDGQASPKKSGNGGAGITTSLTGATNGIQLGGGGGGGGHEANDVAGSATFGGGAGAVRTTTQATSGTQNTGGGGGGSGNPSSGVGWSSQGGNGGSGVVILSYGAYMGVVQTPGGARAGTAFARPITVQLNNTDGTNNAAADVSVTLAAASASVLQQTVGEVTSNITSATATSDASGLVTFTGLGFQSGVGASAQILTFTADAFVGTTLSVAPTFVSTSVTVSSTATTNGQFINGVFQATAAAATNILASDLVTALAGSNVLIESAGNLSVSTGLTSTATNNLTLTCAGTGAFTNSSGAISLAADLSVSCATVTTSAAVETTGTGGVSLTSLTGAMSIGAAISSATDLLVESSTTTALNANLNAGSQGILVKSAGRITGSAGTSALVPRLIRTASGPITLWTTGATGGVQLGNFTQLNSTNSGVGGDITIGGGVATAADPARPSGFAQSSAAAGIALGTTATASGVVMVAGSGNISLSGEHTSTGTYSGVDIFPGVDIVGNQVSIRGTSGHNLTTGGSGVSAYVNSTIKSLIHATGSFVSATTALQIESSSASSTGALLGPSTAATDALTFRASGNNAGISIKGTTSKASSVGLWLASATLEVKNGPTVLDSGDDTITMGKDSGRVFTYRPVNGGAGGDITVNTAGLADSINISLQTAGTVSLIPSADSFASSVAFPTAGSSFNVGGLVVGSTTNTADLTVGAAVTSVGDVTYRGGSNTVSANVSSTAGSVAFYSTGASKAFSKTTATITAFKDVVISSAASTVSTGSGAISAGTVGLSSSSTMTSGAPITSSGIVEIASSAGDTTVSGINNVAANLTISGGIVSVTAAQTTTSSGNLIITPRAGYSGAGALTSAGTLSISGGTTVAPGATVKAAGNLTISGSGQISNTSATLTSTAGTVSLTSTNNNITLAANVSGQSVAILPKTTYAGAGSLTATAEAGTVQISGGSTVDPTGAILASGNVVLRGSGQITTGTNATLTSSTGSVEVTTTGGLVTLGKNVLANTSISISLTGAYSGAGTLTATTGTISITGGTYIEPTGDFTASGAISLSGSAKIYLYGADVISTGGAITMTAGPIADHGVLIRGSTVRAAGQRISLTGTSTSGGGVYIYENSRITNTSGDIEITGTSSGGAGEGVTVIDTSVVSTSSGNIAITGVGSDWGAWFEDVDILSTSGAINVDAGVRGIVSGYGTITNFGATIAGSAIGDITVLGDRHWSGSTAVNYKTSGAVVLNSKASNYTEAPTYNNHTFTGASSVTIGSLTAAHQVTVDATGEIAGLFTVLGQYVYLDPGTSLISTRAAASSGLPNIGFLAKATDRIYMAAGADLETKGSDIVLWSDSDDSGVGSIHLAGSNILKSSGGQISLAGGLDDGGSSNAEFVNRVAGDGRPDNYAGGISGWGDATGVELLGGYQILSGGGDVFIAGRGSAATGDDDWGVLMTGGLVYSVAGKIGIYGKAPASCANNWHRGIATGWGGRTHIVSESTAVDAIYLFGDTATCNNGWAVYASAVQGYNYYTDVVTPNGGGIKIYGTQGNASFYNGAWGTDAQESDILQLNFFNLISNSGPIHAQAVKATTSERWNLRFATRWSARSYLGQIATAVSTGFAAYPTIASVASTSDVTLKADSVVPYIATFNTTGNVSLIPNTTFEPSVKHWFSGTWYTEFPKKMASFTVGAAASGSTPQSTSDLDLAAISTVGPMSLYSGAITQQGTWSSDQDVTVSGTKDLTIGFAVTAGDAALIQTSGGDVLVNASTTAGAGGITYKASRDVLVNTTTKSITTSGGGDIVFWGNSAGTGGEVDTGGPNVTIDSNGGDIVVAGGADNAANDGVASDNIPDNSLLGRTLDHTARLKASMASDAGNIIIRAQHFSGTTTAALSTIVVAASVQLTATTGDILIEGIQNSGNASSGNQYGVWLGNSNTWASRVVVKSDSGNVTINGDASQSVYKQRRGILLFGAEIVATLGNIALNGASPNATDSFDVLGWATSTVTAGGNITVSGARTSAAEFITFNAGGVTTLSVGLLIGGDAGTNTSATTSVPTAFAGTGSVVVEPNGTSFTAAQTMANVTIASTVTGLTVGKSGNTADITLPSAYSVAGNINVTGGAVSVNANQTATGAGSITVKASDNIVVQAGASTSSKTSLQTSGGNITFQSDSDGNSDGYIWVQNFTNISTGVGAGNIVMSGGTDLATGFAAAASVDGQGRAGVLFGEYTAPTPKNADGITVAAGTGDVTIRGKAIGNDQGRGILIPLSSTLANKTSFTGNNITLVGNSESGSGTSWYGIEFGASSAQTATDIKTLLSATGTLSLSGTSSNYDGIVGNGNYEFVGKQIAMTGSGPRQPIRINTTSTLASSIAAGLDGFSYTGTKTNTVTNDSALFKPGSFSSAGATSFVFDGLTSTAGLSIDSAIAVTNADVTVKSNNVELAGSIAAGTGSVKFEPFTSSRVLTAGTEVAGTLSLTAAELGRVTASILRLTAGGDVNLTSNLTFTDKVSTLAIRSGANVVASSGVAVVVANLGIDAVGTITMGGGHSISGNLALNGSGATFSQTSGPYTPNTVDTIAASFGTGDVLSVTAIPEVNGTASDQFMAVTFNPPPVATVKDKYSNSLETNNNLSDDYKVTVTKTSGSGTLEGTTSIDAALGVATFNNLKITGNTGDHVLKFTLATRTGSATFATADVSSGTYNVQAGDPDNLNVLTPASGGTSGAAFTTQPVIQIRDVANNLVALDPGKSAVVTATVSAGGTRVGSATATAVNSVATFSGLGIKGLISGSYTITYSIVFNSATISKAQTGITIASGVATTLEVAQPASVSNAAVFATQPVVTAKDSAGNTATTQVGTVTVAGTSLTGTKTKALVDGVASFAGQDLKLTGTIGTYPLTYTMGSLSTISGVQLTHGVATKLSLSTPAAGFVNRAVFDTAPVITVLDVSNNPVLNSAVEITVESTNAALSGTLTMNAVNGIADFANKGLKLTGTAGDQVLTYKATNLTSASQSFTLLHGAAYELRLVTDGAGAKSGIKFTTSPRVEILDQDANLVKTGTSAGASITASISGAAYNSVTQTGVDLLGTLSLDAVAGVATFNNLRLEGVAGSYTLTFSATAPSAVSSFTDSQTIALLAGTATKLRTVAQPTDIVAGVAFGTTVTVEILDAYNNRVLVATNSITPTLIDTASTPNTIATKTAVAAANGLTTFTGLTFTKAGAHKIVFSATDLTSTTSAEFEITNAAPHHLTWVTQPAGAKNGVALSPAPVLEVRDEYQNPALVGAATTVAASIQPANTDVISVSGASASSNGSARVTFANLVLKAKAGNYGLRFTAANGSLPINGTYVDTTSTVAIAQGAPENLNVLTAATGGTSDAAFTTQPVIQIRDSANNLVLDEPGKSAVVTATISAGGTRVGSATATASNSVATFADLGIKGLVSGNYTITYSIEFNSTTISKDQTGITIGSGVATVLEVVQPAEVSNAVVFATQPVVTAKDSAGNVATTHVGTVAVANVNLTGTKTKALVAGVANFAGQDLKLTGTIGAYNLAYTMGSLQTISGLQLNHGVATKLILSTEAAGFINRENFSAQPVIAVQDQSGNRVLNSAVAVEVSISSATLTGLTTVNALNGLATFSDLGKFGAVGSKTLTFKSTGLADATQTFLLTHGAATKLELTTAASSAKAGIAFGGQPVVRVLDADDNLVNTGDNASATIAVSTSAAAYNAANHTGADLLGTLSAQASAGVATFAGLHIDGVAATYSLSYSATAPAAITGFTAVTQNLAVAAGTKTALRTVAQPTDIVAGVAFGSTVTVEILDAYNNRVLVATNAITPTLIDTASTPNTIATKTAVAAVSGLTTFTGLTFTKAGAHNIVFSATDLTSTTSAEFDITNAAPHHLTWVTQPTGAKNGVALSPAPVLEVRDVYENPALVGAATTVAASIQPANTDVISVSGASASSNGSARVTFANLVLKAKAGNYGLRFTAANGSLPINGTYVDTTSTVAIAQGAPENLNVLTAAAGGTSDAAFTTQPVIQIRDSANNLVLDEPGKSAVVTATISAGGTRVGSATATAVNSVATFAGLGIKGLVSGSYTITYAIEFNSTTISKDQTGITIGSGVATVLEVVQPGEVSNAVVFATQPVVTAKDSAGNVATTQVGTVAVANGSLTGTKTKALVAGVANFSGQELKLTGTIGTYPLTYTMGSLTTISSVTLKHGVATKLELTTPAAGFVNRQVFETAPVITVLDVSNNQVLDSAVEITVESTNAVLSGTEAMTAVSGRANFANNNLTLTGTVGAQTLTYKATDLTSASQSFTLLHGAATKLELTTAASSAKAGIAFGGQPVVRVLDADNNLVNTGNNASATIAVSTSAAAYNAANHSGADLLGTLTAQASAGVATFAGLHIDGVAATYSLSYSATAPAAITDFTAVTQTLAVAAGTQTALRTATQPTDIVAGVAFGATVTVEILDAFNNRVLLATNDITPTLIDTALVPTTIDATKTAVTAVDGLATFTGLTFTKAGSHKVLFTATNLPGADLTSATSSAFTITNAAPHHLTWITQPTGAKNDVALSPAPVLEVRDEFENPALTGAATTVAASIQPANSDVISVSGASATSNTSARVTFANLVLKAKIGNYGLRFTSTNGTLPINGTHIDTTSTVAITHGDPTQLAITTAAAAAKAGFAFGTQPVVEVRDSAGNRVADSALTITASMTNREAIGTATAVASNGVATFANLGLNGASATGLQLNFKTTFSSTEIATSQLINLSAGAAIEVVMTQQPATVKTRDAFTIAPSVTLLDLWQNPVLSDNETQVTAQLIDSTGTPVGSKSTPVTAVAGTATFSTLAFTATPTTGYRIKFEMAAAGDTVLSDSFTINPGTATKLLITTQPATVEAGGSKTKTGEPLATQPVAKLYDQDDNLVTTANSGSATVSIGSGASASLSEGSTTANFVGGIATFAGVKLVGTPNASYTLAFASTTPNPALTSAASNSISVMHNDAFRLVLTQSAANGRAGDAFDVQPQITIQDRYSNTVTTGTGAGLTVRASAEITAPTAGAATLIGGTQRNAIAGVATFGSLGIGGSTANTYKINFSISSSTVVAASQSEIQITYGYSDRVVMVTQPVGGNATGDALATQPVVAVQDAYGNLVADAADTVTASIVSTAGLTLADASVARLTGESVNAQNGTATFTALKLFGLPTTNYVLQFTIGQNPATANAISVTHAVAHHATIVSQPVGGNATGANLAGQPVVELRDQFENIVTSNNTDVLTAHLASSTGTNLAGGSSDPERLAGSTTAVFSSGVATFAGLKVIALPETLYTLNFDATVGVAPIASATSTTFGVTYSTATKLAVFQQPVANVTGELLTTQPIIEVQDIYGNRVRNYAGMVAVTLPQANSTLSNSTYAGTATQFEAVIADGRATFGGLEITAIPGTDYQLNFALSPLTSINSGNLRVVAAAPFEVLMVTQPVGAQTNATLSGQPVVRVVDRFGNTVLSDSSTVITASIADGIGGVLSRVANGNAQPLAVTVANGVGTFDYLNFRGVSLRNYKLTFEATGLAAATSNNFFVTHADASKLTFTTQPVAGATGLALTTQPILELRDFDENIAATDNSSVVTASITSGVGGTLSGATATAVEGVVTFDALTLVGTPGVAYQITFTGDLGVLGSVTSLPSGNITPLHGAPNQLAMRGTAVVGGLVGEDLVAQPKLNVLDSFGNLATTDDLTVVTASILADATGAVLGTTTATAVDGLVDFAGLKATGTPGTAYTLIFSATSSGTTLATVDSNTFTLSKQASVSLSYAAQAYSPDALVAPVFATDSPGVVTYLNTTTEADICTLNTTTGEITIKGAGTCSVNVSVAATEFYLANSVDADLEIAKARQTAITITSAATINYWGTVYPAATGGSGEGVMTFAVNGTCKLVANTVIPGDAGSRCRLTATKPGDENYLAEGSATQTITIQKIDQAPLMIASASDLKVGTLELVAAGGSGTGALTYGVVTTNRTNSANCSIVGAVLTATTNGVCSVKATKAASTNYNAVETSIQLITVSKQEQSVAFSSTVPMFPVALGSYTPTASASSALAVGFSLVTDAQNPACQLDPLNRAKVVFLIAGECEIVASQAGNDVFSSASASQTIQVGILNQSIVFAAITDKQFGTPGFIVSASSNSGLPVSLATTSNSDACTLASNGLVALTGAGLCEISATQAGNLTYGPASLVTRSFNVLADFAGAPQIISVSSASQAFTASFTAPSYTGGSPILGYKLMLTDVNGEVYTNSACAIAGSPLTCTVVGLPNNIAYTAKVAAVTVAGIGSFSSSSVARTPLEAPLAVNNLAASPAAGNLVVNWDVPTVSDDVFLSEFVSYEVYVAPIGTAFPALPSATILQANATSTTIALSNSTPVEGASVRSASFGRASFSRAAVSTPTPTPSPTTASIAGYNIRVVTVTTSAAVSTNDNTTNGVQIGFAVPFAPAQMILDPQTTSLWISWSAPTADGGQPVLNYDVRVNGELACPATTDFECTFVGMAPGTTYNVEVFARSAVGLSPAAVDSYATPVPPAVYEAPVVSPSPSATSPAPVVPTVKPTVRPTVRPTVKPTAEPTTGPIAKPGAAIENDIDGDGIINNEDSDIDGDGIANGLDDDIDGDGKPNFDDGDPAGTNGGGNQAPEKPASPILQPLSDGGAWLFIPALVLAFIGGLFALRKKRKSS